ncbi:hypothetical protein BDN72DRAFT_832240 [Pluteus cervinus]|uniref:Uncharacterized protein n=1 Tax=Pluteus cervinus TaxID=181527 RepID=A0ACD3BC01_9AGAR|nr:hypothetical protein BDN72DRAFT_832240 [Pluteus cervinus]
MVFNNLVLAACICVFIALISYFFYWNRIIAFLLSRILRLLFWNQEASSIWIDLGAIHFSLLAGRILLKDVVYHSSNQSFRIVKVQIQWRYWIRRPTSEDEIGNNPAMDDDKFLSRALSCRVQLTFEGFEWFMYNRTASYEHILSQLEALAQSRPTSRSTARRASLPKRSEAASRPAFLARTLGSHSVFVPRFILNSLAWIRSQLPSLDPKDLLPLGLEIVKGAIICGNATTENLLVSEFQRAEGTYGIVPSRSPHDLYKQVLALRVKSASIRLVENDQYVRDHDMAGFGELFHSFIKEHHPFTRDPPLSFSSFTKVWRQLKLYAAAEKHAKRFRKSKKTKQPVEEESHVGDDFTHVEYAIERKILEAPVLELSYYADVVGLVPSTPDVATGMKLDSLDIGNGSMPPEWGVDLVIRGGFIRYGPWADRQRSDLQKAFFPSTFQDITPTPRLVPGERRVWTSMRVFVELRDETVLQIPFREPSKNWQWDGQTELPKPRPRKRESAWIHLKAGDRSSINYIMPMVAGPKGYEANLEVHLDDIAVTSSLNDIRLVVAESCRVRCDLPAPLRWNAERKWDIAVYLRQPTLYLLRDHINMFTDLGKDWTTGPPTDFQRFIPMIYGFHLELHHYVLYLYTNDHNIIDKPLIKEDNAFIVGRGPLFKSDVTIFSNKFRPESTTIPFHVEIPDPSLSLSLPRWNTHALHAPADGNTLGKLGTLRINGSYQYFAEVREEYVEQLKLDFTANRLAFKALGWSIRYFMVFKDNYFGSFTHFSTLYEYLDNKRHNRPPGDPIIAKYRVGKANPMQVEMTVCVFHAEVVLPAGLPGFERASQTDTLDTTTIGSCLVLVIPEFQLQFRMHDYFMEMSLNIGTITGVLDNEYPEKLRLPDERRKIDEVLYIGSLDITAHRLFGPQPRTATYLCIWEIHIGQLKSSLSASEGFLLGAVGDAFGLNFADVPNAPAAEYTPPLDPDITFLKFSLDRVDLVWRAGFAAAVLSLPDGLKLTTNDLGGSFFKKILSVQLPAAFLKVLLTASSEQKPWLEAAEVSGDLYMDLYSSPGGWREHLETQLAFVSEQDHLTDRSLTMISALQRSGDVRGSHRSGLFLPQPVLADAGPRRTRGTVVKGANSHLAVLYDPATSRASESEGEEGISEADRDARLAKTRASTPLPAPKLNEDDQNMSSGDESDNEDFTDAESTDSDWSDDPDIPSSSRPPPGSKSLLNFYTHYSSHYAAQDLGRPCYWNGSPFVLTRSRDPTHQRPEMQDARSSPFKDPLPRESPNCTVTYRVCGRQPFVVRLTPLILPAVAYFDQDLDQYVPSPELLVDWIMARFLSGFPPKKETAPSSVFLDLRLPSVSMTILQHIAMNDAGEPVFSPQTARLQSPSLLDMVSHFTLNLEHVTVSTLLGPATFVNGSLAGLSFAFCTSSAGRTITPNNFPHTETKIDVNLSHIHMVRQKSSLTFSWEGLAIKVGHQSINFALTACLAVGRTSKQLTKLVRRRKSQNTAKIKSTIYGILKASEGKDIIDPLSTIQPSYLIQGGTPRNLRMDSNFRLIYHLRNCLWHVSSASLPQWCETVSADSNTLETLLLAHLERLDMDADTVANFFMFLALGGSGQPMEVPKSLSSLKAVVIQLGSTSYTVLDPLGRSSSSLLFKDVQAAFRIREMDTIHFSAPIAGLSQVSLRESQAIRTRQIFVSLIVGDVQIAIFPHLMRFVEYVLRVRRHYLYTWGRKLPRHEANVSKAPSTPLLSVAFTGVVRQFKVQAVAKNLAFEFGATTLQIISSALFQSSLSRADQSINTSFLCDTVFVRARSPPHPQQPNDQDILASLDFSGTKINCVGRQDAIGLGKPSICVTFTLQAIRFQVPRSALRLYHFIEEWRVDFLAEIGTSLQALLNEFQQVPTKPTSPTSTQASVRHPMVQVQGEIGRFGISLQIMHGTWLTWEVNNATVFLDTSKSNGFEAGQVMGLHLSTQIIMVANRASSADAVPNTRVKLVLPAISMTGRYDGLILHGLIMVQPIELKVKPSHWDTLLVVQQKFGQDFNDLLALVRETRARHSMPAGHGPTRIQRPFRCGISFKIQGFRVGLEGITSTVYLECQDIGGGFQNVINQKWHLAMSDLALSLEPRSTKSIHRELKQSNNRSAFVRINVKLSTNGAEDESFSGNTLDLSFTSIHAVMQASSIGEVGDFVDHLQAEVLQRKEQRAAELAAFKEKTQNILRTFEVRVKDIQADEDNSWLDDYTVNVSIQNVGVAFPLTLDKELGVLGATRADTDSVRAFLFSIKSIGFSSQRGESGQAVMKDFAFQFVPQFNQSNPSDFSGSQHPRRNRLIYPQMKAQLRSKRSAATRNIWAVADVSGFVLDLDSSIPDYVFSLIDVYRQGKARMERLSAYVPRTPSSADATIIPNSPLLEKRDVPRITSNIFASLTFASGKVCIHSSSMTHLPRTRTVSHAGEEEHFSDLGAEVFNLPVVSVWAEYRGAVRRPSQEAISTLIFKNTVHSSQNMLKPNLLPFLTELVTHIETRLRKISLRAELSSSLMIPEPEITLSPIEDVSQDSSASMQISFSLRIDQSKLELSCQPDVNVVAGVHWESGGFIVNISPGARRVTFTGSVGGLTVGLKHGFLSEHCVKLDARNLAFSVNFSKLDDGDSASSLSVVLDTEFHGDVRFSRLQDILCFKAVWLDRIPLFTQGALPSKATTKLSQAPPPTQAPQQALSTVVLFRIRKIVMDVDLGRSISTVNVQLDDAIMRTSLTEIMHDLSVFVGKVAITASGNIAGHAVVPNCMFATTRRTNNDPLLDPEGKGRMLVLRMTSGPLVVTLESEQQMLLHYHADPLEVEVVDDWSQFGVLATGTSPLVKLAFTVTSPKIVAVVTVGTIPRLMLYAAKFKTNLDAQREGASRESKTFRVTRTPKPDNPLSAVAEAMLQSARSRFKEAETTLSHAIEQHMTLRLQSLHLVLFPRKMDDVEMAQFVGRDVQAMLIRTLQGLHTPATREIQLAFSSMMISKATQLSHPPRVLGATVDIDEWLRAVTQHASVATIAGLPSMTMHMVSEVTSQEESNLLQYDFQSKFIRKAEERDKEDIYITLNVSLYSWLTILRKTLTREMDQIKASTAQRPARKKLPEPLNLNQAHPISPPELTGPPFLPPPISSRYATAEFSPSSPLPTPGPMSPSPAVPFPALKDLQEGSANDVPVEKGKTEYRHRSRQIERLTMRQLGEATPDVMHPFFMKKAGFNLEDSLPQYVHEYATLPLEEIMEVLLTLYNRQLLSGKPQPLRRVPSNL